MPTKYYYDGSYAANIRVRTRGIIKTIVTDALEEQGITVGSGSGGVPLLRSITSASERYKGGRPFVLLHLKPHEQVRCRVLGHDDSLAHSGRKLFWTFIIQVSKGRTGNLETPDQTTEADDALMDAVRAALDSKYVTLRDEHHFSDVQVNRGALENVSLLNPIKLTFSNTIRLSTDEFITVPNV